MPDNPGKTKVIQELFKWILPLMGIKFVPGATSKFGFDEDGTLVSHRVAFTNFLL